MLRTVLIKSLLNADHSLPEALGSFGLEMLQRGFFSYHVGTRRERQVSSSLPPSGWIRKFDSSNVC